MKYVFIFILGIGLIMAAATYVNTDKISGTAFLGSTINSRTKEIRNSIQEKIVPKDPEEKRATLLNDLKGTVEELKNRTEKQGIAQDVKFKNVSTPQLIKNSEEIINNLENTNTDKTIGQKLTDKILDNIFPLQEKESKADCKN